MTNSLDRTSVPPLLPWQRGLSRRLGPRLAVRAVNFYCAWVLRPVGVFAEATGLALLAASGRGSPANVAEREAR